MGNDRNWQEQGFFIEPEEEESDGREWLTTFADLSMLLLVFFVLLYSMSSLDTDKFSSAFSSVTHALQGKLEEISTSRVSQEEAGVLLDQVIMQKQIVESQRKVFTDVKTLQVEKGIEGLLSASFENGQVILTVPGDVLFAPGEVRLSPAGKQLIAQLKDMFVQHPDQAINIRGYTDDVPPSGTRWVDNWEISAMRAVNVLRFVMSMGIEAKRLTATGLADLDPEVPNSTEENRARNRRVEFIMEKKVTVEQ